MLPRLICFDVDGTLAETEADHHRVAFNRAFRDLGVPWRWDLDEYGELLAIAGGFDRVLYDMERRDGVPEVPDTSAERRELAAAIQAAKTDHHLALLAESCPPLRPGIAELIEDCRRMRVAIAITSSSSRASVSALLRHHFGPARQRPFVVEICRDDVERGKPHPDIYAAALRRVGVRAVDAIAIEDSPVGVESGCAAGLSVVMARSRFFADAAIRGALAVGPGLGSRTGWIPLAPLSADDDRIRLDDIADWHQRAAEQRRARSIRRAG